jgi:hypothetical protein
MANIRPANAARNAQLNAIRNLIDAGAAGGKIKIYTGTQPATGDTALSGNTLLGTLVFSTTSAADAAAGVLTFSSITSDASADATGTATWARITDSDDVSVLDCDVGTSGATINLATTSITAGGTIALTSGTITAPAT